MDPDPDDTKARPGPPPPDLPKRPVPPPPAPSLPDPPAAADVPKPSSEPPLKVSVAREGNGEEDPGGGGASRGPAEGAPGSDASFNDRIIGAVIDFLIAAGLSVGVTWLFPSFLNQLGTLLSVGYLLCRDSLPFLEGQSVGKKAVGTCAVTMDGGSLAGNWQPGLVRNAVLLIPFFALVELFVLITRQDAPGLTLRLGDEWARTKVINVPRREEPEQGEIGGQS